SILPSGRSDNSTTATSVDDRFTYRIADRTTPRATAAWIGRKSVPTKVVPPARREVQPASQTERTSAGFRLPSPASINNAPSAGIAMYEMRRCRATRKSLNQTPARIVDQRVAAPEITFSAVALREPPTGRPRKKPDARLAAP